jgi:hypothetical protein
MGHTRLGTLPHTRKWHQVVALIEAGADVPLVADATARAAEQGLSAVANDPGLAEAVWLLSQLPAAARSADFTGYLHHCGIDVPAAAGFMEVVTFVSSAVDGRFPGNHGRTDAAELSQSALSEALFEVVGPATKNLFGSGPADVKQAFSRFGTPAQFGKLVRAFFSRLTYKCLDSLVSRTAGQHTGPGQRFTTLAQERRFTEALGLHCHEAAQIVEKFAGDWLSKGNWKHGGITRASAAAFASEAVRKVVAELGRRANPDGR